MLFNSYIFIFAFLPVCLLGFYGLKGIKNLPFAGAAGEGYATLTVGPRAAKIWLIAMSLWFYGYFNLRYLAIMIFSIVCNYLCYLLMKKSGFGSGNGNNSAPSVNKAINGEPPVNKAINSEPYVWKAAGGMVNSRVVMVTGVIINLSVLFYFKYFDFFIDSCNVIFKTDMALRGILLPLGISFFTFQQIGFLTDAYRGRIEDCNPIDYTLFVSFFPQLIAGPIVNHEEMMPQFARIGERIDRSKIARGLYVFILGMAKKVLIADTFGKSVDFAYLNLSSGINATESLLTILFYSLQLYFDFSGYCDMAIGLGLMLGIDIPLNFNSPYKAVDIVDFWKRWHITLSRFFTKNIYIPLGGNRRGEGRMYLNLFIVFFLSGLWHGAGFNYILWGLMHGIVYVLTRAFRIHFGGQKRGGRVVRIFSCLLTFAFVNIAWVYFRAPSVGAANTLISNLFNGAWIKPSESFAGGFNLGEFWYVMKILHLTDFSFSRYILMIVFTLFTLIITFFGRNVHELADRTEYTAWTGIILGILSVWCIVSLSGVSTFLYFNF